MTCPAPVKPTHRRSTYVWLLLGAMELLLAWIVVLRPAWALVVCLSTCVALSGWIKQRSGLIEASPSPAPLAAVRGTVEPEHGTFDKGQMPIVWRTTVLALFVVVVDIQAILTRQGSRGYLALLVVLIVTAGLMAVRKHGAGSRVVRSDVILGVLFIWGLLGSIYGKAVLQTATTTLSMFAPMSVFLVRYIRGPRPTEQAARAFLQRITQIGAVFTGLYLAAWLGLPFLSLNQFSHDRAFLLAVAVVASWLSNNRLLLVCELTAIAVIFSIHPAGTFVTTTGVVLATNLLLNERPRRLLTAAVLAGLIGIVVVGFRQASSSVVVSNGGKSGIMSEYFSAVGKQDNSAFREEMARRGLEEVRRQPVFGSQFTGESSIRTAFPGAGGHALLHNDYLQIAVGGGLIGLSLFIAWIWSTNALAFPAYRRLKSQELHAQAAVLRTLLSGINGLLAVALFNPVLSQVGVGVTAFLLYGSLMVFCEGAGRRADEVSAHTAPAAR